MKHIKPSLNLVAGAALALCSALATVAQAAPTQADLDSIVLYGSTTIAQDSASAWGVWEQIDPPAAGPQLPRLDNFSKAELYRPLAQLTLTAPVTDTLCTSGGICGFGVFYDYRGYGGELVAKAVGNDSVQANIDSDVEHPYVFTANPLASPEVFEQPALPALEQPAANVSSSVVVPAAVEILGKALDNGSLLLPNSGTLVQSGWGYRSFQSTEGAPYYAIWAASWNNDYFDPAAVGATWYEGYISQYVAGIGEQRGQFVEQDIYGVVGYTTPQGDMSALRASNATATYAGYDYKSGSDTPNVILNVDFGRSTFTGSFNGGSDGGTSGNKVSVGTSAEGTVVNGAVGFNVTSGVIAGSEFKSTSLSATDGTVSGTVRGAFFGPLAAAAGGVADVVKTRTDGTYSNARFVSPFLAIKDLNPKSIRGRFND